MPANFSDDESTCGSNEFFIEGKSIRRNRKTQGLNWFWILLGILGIVGIVELVVLGTIFVQATSKDPAAPLLGELNGLVPNFSVRQVLFRKDAAATVEGSSEEARNATHDNWLSYVPKGNGFIAVNNTERHVLPDPILFQGHNAYSIAVFHQLHCLYTIMDVYNSLANPMHKEQGGSASHEHSHLDTHDHNHVNHCFRYLRQSLQCCGDTALEGQDPNSKGFGTDGTGAVHVCKDYDAIRSWAEQHRLVNTKHV